MDLYERPLSRKQFLKTAAVLAVTAVARPALTQPEAFALDLGVCTSYDKADLLKSLGYTYVEENVGRFLIPESGDAQYRKNFDALQAVRLPIRSYVSFIPGNIKSVGADANHEALLARADLAFNRAKECGAAFVVFGSSGSRSVPEGFDRQKAKEQHVEVSKKMALLAEKHQIVVAIEPLNRGETNFINSLAEGVEIIEAVNHPRFRLLCDIYHMSKENEGPEQILKYGQYIVHCHVAEKQNRTPPGVAGDDFKAYFGALKKIKYQGSLSLECRWKDFDNEVKTAIEVLKKQFSEV